MQIHVVDLFFGFVEVRFVTVFVLHKDFPSASTVRFFRILNYYYKLQENIGNR